MMMPVVIFGAIVRLPEIRKLSRNCSRSKDLGLPLHYMHYEKHLALETLLQSSPWDHIVKGEVRLAGHKLRLKGMYALLTYSEQNSNPDAVVKKACVQKGGKRNYMYFVFFLQESDVQLLGCNAKKICEIGSSKHRA